MQQNDKDRCGTWVSSDCLFYQYYYQMSKSLKLVIRNSKQHPLPISDSPRTLTPASRPIPVDVDLSDRINLLEGNLRMLEKRYRANLKEGFDHKIKAYRLQAVVERRMLKEAIEETHRAHEREQIREKMEVNERERRLDESRALIAQHQKEERLKFIKMRNIREKRSLSLTSHERKAEMERQLRQAHDRIAEEEANINRKKEYFDFIRRASLKRQELEYKKQLLQKIVCNTQRLKDLKYTLQDLRSSDRQSTFVTM